MKNKEWTWMQSEIVRVIDGDTVVARLTSVCKQEFDFGFYMKDQVTQTHTVDINLRLAGINTPEIRGEQKEAGLVSKDALIYMLGERFKAKGGQLRVVTHKPGKYGGRWIATLYMVFPPTESDLAEGAAEFTICLNKLLIDEGYAVPYGKPTWE